MAGGVIAEVARKLGEVRSFDQFLTWFEWLPTWMQWVFGIGVVGVTAILLTFIIAPFMDNEQ